LLSESDDFSGESLISPCIPMKYKPGYKKGKITMERHCTLGAKCTILPGVTMREGSIAGAHSLIVKDCDPWGLYVGVPARRIRERSQKMVELGKGFLDEYAAENPDVLVSIVCLAYNQELYIREALDGMLMQKTGFPFEIIIHDDASTDKTADIIREYARRYPRIIRTIFQTENQFRSTGKYPIMHAYAAARGRYVAECDGDDFWTDPLKLQKQVDFLEANPDYVMCHHDYKLLSRGVLVTPSAHKPRDFSKDELIAFSPDGYGIAGCTKMYRNLFTAGTKKDFEDFQGDYPLNVLLGTYGKCKYIEGIHPSVYRKHGRNSWAALSPGEITMRTQTMYRRLYELMVARGNPHYIALREGFLHG